MFKENYRAVFDGITPDTDLISNTLNTKRISGNYRTAQIYRLVAIITIASVLVLTTAFAFSYEIAGFIRQFTFGNSTAAQIEHYAGSTSIEIINSDTTGLDIDGNIEPVSLVFATVEEAGEFASLEINLPSYLPDSWVLTEYGIIVARDIWGGMLVTCVFKSDLSEHFIGLNQNYVGPDAYIDLKSGFPVQKVTDGDFEAVLIPIDKANIYDTYGIYELHWIKDGMFYRLFAFERDLDIETLTKIAVSIG